MIHSYCCCKINPYKAQTVPVGQTFAGTLFICSACLKPPIHIWHHTVDECKCGALFASPYDGACERCSEGYRGWSWVASCMRDRPELVLYRSGKISRSAFKNLLTLLQPSGMLSISEAARETLTPHRKIQTITTNFDLDF